MVFEGLVHIREIIYEKLWIVLNLSVLVTQLYYNYLLKKNTKIMYEISKDCLLKSSQNFEEVTLTEQNYKERIAFLVYSFNRDIKYAIDELKVMRVIGDDYLFSLRLVIFSLFIYEYTRLDTIFFILILILFINLYKLIKKRCKIFKEEVDEMIHKLKVCHSETEQKLLAEERIIDDLIKNKK